MAVAGVSDTYIQTVWGFGSFQILLLVAVIIPVLPTTSFTLLFMSFGNYNPGWTCQDNINITWNNHSTLLENNHSLIYHSDESCNAYKDCINVVFDKESSTVVTEWTLVCDQSWAASLIISVQMFGMLIGSYVGGQLADSFGRKKILYISIALCGTLQLVTALSTSWMMFAALTFFIGALCNCNFVIILVYISEYMTSKARNILMVFPFWYIGALLLALMAYVFKNWRHVMMVGVVLHAICLLPVLIVPESLRWLEVKGKTKQFYDVASRISKMNGSANIPTLEDSKKQNDESNAEDCVTKTQKGKLSNNGYIYTIRDIFGNGYRMTTICVGLLALLLSTNYYALTFGTKSFYGDFYLNLAISNIAPIPFFLCGLYSLKELPRKKNYLVFLFISILSAIVATGMLLSPWKITRDIFSTIFISIARGTLDFAWFCTYPHITEMYPTVVRGISLGYATVLARTGGVLAPYIIPHEKADMYIFTIGTSISLILCCVVQSFLPETKGKQLRETFNQSLEMIPDHQCYNKARNNETDTEIFEIKQ